MENVMAALNTFGIEYDPYEYGFEVEKDLLYLKNRTNQEFGKMEEIPVDLINFAENDFETKFEEFVNMPHFNKISGAYWADDDGYVVIQFSRMYNMTENDWDDFVAWCGCESPEEAIANYGEPSPTYIYLNVRIKKGEIGGFVSKYAHYCW